MPISKEEFVELYPTLYHVSLAPDLEHIRKHGLLSTSALLDLFEVTGTRRYKLESCRRLQSEPLSHPLHGKVFLNDQSPLQEGPLCRCLQDMSPGEWMRELNRRVFFFPTKRRVYGLLNARLARDRHRIAIVLETAALLDFGADHIELSAINSGCATRKAPLRGKTTFQPLHRYPFEERRKRLGPAGAIAEVTFPYAIPAGNHFRLAAL